jgi:hypothetical protein
LQYFALTADMPRLNTLRAALLEKAIDLNVPTNRPVPHFVEKNACSRHKISTNNVIKFQRQPLESGSARSLAVPHLQTETYLGDRFFAADENFWRRPDCLHDSDIGAGICRDSR